MAVEISQELEETADPRLLIVAASLFAVGGVLSSSFLISVILLGSSVVASAVAFAFVE